MVTYHKPNEPKIESINCSLQSVNSPRKGSRRTDLALQTSRVVFTINNRNKIELSLILNLKIRNLKIPHTLSKHFSSFEILSIASIS